MKSSLYRAFMFSVKLASIVLLLWSSRGYAAGINFSSSPVSHDSRLSLGWEFSTVKDVTVTRLGYFDADLDGLFTCHEIGLFDTYGNLLASATVSEGTTSPLIGQFRYQAITPLTLSAGTKYLIAATTHGWFDGWAYGRADTTLREFSVEGSIVVHDEAARYLYQDDNKLRYPTEKCCGYTVYGGPNFLTATDEAANVQTPEPNAVTLVLSAFICMAWLYRKPAREKNR